MPSLNPIVRVAGIIMWHLRRGKSEEDAVAYAWKRQPELSAADMAAALEHAKCHEQACDIASGQCRMVFARLVAEREGKPDPYPDGLRLHTAEEIHRAAGYDI